MLGVYRTTNIRYRWGWVHSTFWNKKFHWGMDIKKPATLCDRFTYLLTYLNYLTMVVSATGATVESTATAVVSTATAVESVVASDVPLPPQATNVVAIAKIAITFFICLFLLFKFNCTH